MTYTKNSKKNYNYTPPKKYPPPKPKTLPIETPKSNGLFSVFTQGLAWGTGNAVAHKITDNIFSPNHTKNEVISETKNINISCDKLY